MKIFKAIFAIFLLLAMIGVVMPQPVKLLDEDDSSGEQDDGGRTYKQICRAINPAPFSPGGFAGGNTGMWCP